MTRRNFWALLAGLPVVLAGTALAAQHVGGTATPQAGACCDPDCCPPGCCDEGTAAKQSDGRDPCCPPSCCTGGNK
jgi:hypothetical protein